MKLLLVYHPANGKRYTKQKTEKVTSREIVGIVKIIARIQDQEMGSYYLYSNKINPAISWKSMLPLLHNSGSPGEEFELIRSSAGCEF